MRISVCVPYWNRPVALARMCAQYRDLYRHLDVEVSVCDDGSPVPALVRTDIVVTRLPAKQGALNPCVPMNAAVAASSGELIVLTNPEVVHRGPVLDDMLSLLESDDDYVTARCIDEGKRTVVAGVELDRRARSRWPLPIGADLHFCAILHRSLWERAGGFDERYRNGKGYEDADWAWRLTRAGARFRRSQATVDHAIAPRSHWSVGSNAGLFRRTWPHASENTVCLV